MKKFVRNIKKTLKKLIEDKKKKLLVVSGIVIVIILIVVLIVLYINRESINVFATPDERKFKNEYESLNSVVNDEGLNYPKVKLPINNNMKYSNINEVIEIFNNNEDAVIYFGFPSCLYCRSAVEVLCNTAKGTKINTIYYLDIEGTNDKYKELIDIMGNKFTVDEKGEELYAPLVVFVANGDIVSYNKGTLISQKTPYIKLDKYQVQGLSEIYEYGVKDVLRSIELKNSIK